MIYLPITVLNYSFQYRYGSIHYNPDCLIDSNLIEVSGLLEPGNEELYRKVGHFSEDSDIIFLGLETMPPHETNNIYQIDINSFTCIKVLTIDSIEIVRIKLGTKKQISQLDYSLASRILELRNKNIAFKGADFLLNLLSINLTQELDELKQHLLQSMNRFRNDVNFIADSIFDHIIKYERDQAFQNSDVGFLQDCGRLLKSNFCYDYLDDDERSKYKPIFIEPFRKIYNELHSKRAPDLIDIIMMIKNEEALKELMSEFKFFETDRDHISSIIIYLKLRSVIRRDSLHETQPIRFSKYLLELKEQFPLETAEAVTMLGIRFGITEFVSLFEINLSEKGYTDKTEDFYKDPYRQPDIVSEQIEIPNARKVRGSKTSKVVEEKPKKKVKKEITEPKAKKPSKTAKKPEASDDQNKEGTLFD